MVIYVWCQHRHVIIIGVSTFQNLGVRFPFPSLSSFPSPSFPFPSLASPSPISARGSEGAVSSPSGVWGGAPAENDFDAF
jgi:hypothetical protein